jgi:hypothetical protein
MINAAAEAMDLIMPCFTAFAACATLLMCFPLPLSNRSTSHGACPEFCYTVPAKVEVFRKRKYSIEDQAETVTEEITMPMVLPPPPSIDQKS